MRFAKKFIAVFGLTLLLLLPTASVSADGEIFQACNEPSAKDSALCNSAHETGGQDASSNMLYGPNGIITKVVKILSQVIGFVAVLMIMVGGFKYVTSMGDSNSVNSAKNTILYAVIGLVVAILGQSIVVLVLNKVAT